MNLPFTSLNGLQKNNLTERFSVLPFPPYAIYKALIEIDAEITNADCRTDVMFLSSSSVKNFFERLLENADLIQKCGCVNMTEYWDRKNCQLHKHLAE